MLTLASHLALALSIHVAVARFLHSLPEDTYAFPKFRVAFLNSLPVLNETAERWLKDGLPGGELEFLDQSQKFSPYFPFANQKGIESGQSSDETVSADESPASEDFTLELLRLGPRDSYVCLIPRPLENIPSPPTNNEPDPELTAARSWALLKPLTGTCLYHRHGWFTYSYCHNHEIRQFKELVPQSPRLAGTYVPEEDPEWESYTLGRAPTQPAPGADLTVAEQNAHATNLELAKNAGSRYLVQRWGDGTPCDKTGKNREVEVQFHCSMIMTDSILFVKETKTCSYVLVINTPRLCGEPGFKSRRDTGEEAEIRCREIVDTLPDKPLNYPIADYPVKGGPAPRKPNLPAAAAARPTEDPTPDANSADDGSSPAGEESANDEEQEQIVNDLLLQAIEALVKRTRGTKAGKVGDPTEIVIELGEDMEDAQAVSDKLLDALRSAGYDVLNAEVLGLEITDIPSSKNEKDKEKNGNGNNKKEGKRRRLRRSTDDVDEYARDEL